MDSFAIRNCKIMTIKLLITNTRNVVIDSTEFRGAFERNSLCPSITIITVSHSTSITLSNNNFSTCTLYNDDTIVEFDITEHQSYLTITKRTFTEVIGYLFQEIKDFRVILVNMPKDKASELTINESRFIRNSKVKILTVYAFSVGNYDVSVLLHGLDIVNNTATSALVEIKALKC